MAYLAYFLSLATLGTFLCKWLVPDVRSLRNVLPVFWWSFGARAALAWANETYVFFDSKGAGNYPLVWTQQFLDFLTGTGASPVWLDKWVLQGLLLAPSSVIFGVDRGFLLLNNCFIGAVCGVVAFYYLARLYGESVGIVGLLLFTLYPGAAIFSIFGLRDPLIMLAVTINGLSFLAIVEDKRDGHRVPKGDIAVYAASLVAAVSLRRPLALLFITLPFIWWVASGTARRRLQVFRMRFSRCVVVGTVTTTIVVMLMGGTLIYWYSVGWFTDGRLVSPFEIISVYGEKRIARTLHSTNFGSNILSYDSYVQLPVAFRFALQVTGIIVVPMPWLLRGASRMFAALDSIFLVFCIATALQALRASPRGSRTRVTLVTLLLFFAIGVLALGTIIVNGGNAFRMRLSITPFVLVPAAIYLGELMPTFASRPRGKSPALEPERAENSR